MTEETTNASRRLSTKGPQRDSVKLLVPANVSKARVFGEPEFQDR